MDIDEKIRLFNELPLKERKNPENLDLTEEENLLVKQCKSLRENYCYKLKYLKDFPEKRNQCRQCLNKKRKKDKIKKDYKIIGKIRSILNDVELDDFDSITENNHLFYVGKLKLIKKLLS